MKKKIISLLTAAMLVVSMGTTVFAAGSPTAGDITPVKPVAPDQSQTVKVDKVENVKTPEEYAEEAKKGTTATVKNDAGQVVDVEVTVAPVQETTVETTVKVVEEQLKNVEQVAETIGSDKLKEVAKDSTKKVVPTIATVVNVSTDDVVVTEDNKISVTIPAEVKAGEDILILHWSSDLQAWETIKPDSVVDGAVTATFSSLSPIAVVKLSVAEADPETPGTDDPQNPTPGTQDPAQKPSNGGAAGTTNTNANAAKANTANANAAKAATTTKTSPKTGWSLL